MVCAAGATSPQRGEVMQSLIFVHLKARTVVARVVVFGEAAGATPLCLRALPARGAVIGAERGRGVEARGPVAAIAGKTAEAALRLGDLDIALRQFVEKARRNIGLPQPVHAAVGGEIDFRPFARAR